MMIRLQPQRVEAGRLLAWLAEVLKKSNAVSVELVVLDQRNRGSSVQITLHDVPGLLPGLQVQAAKGK